MKRHVTGKNRFVRQNQVKPSCIDKVNILQMTSCCLFLSMLVGELHTAPYDGASEPLGEDRSIRAHPPLHRVAEQQQHKLLLNLDIGQLVY